MHSYVHLTTSFIPVIDRSLPNINDRSCRTADWTGGPDRVYFLAFLNPSRGQPGPSLTARLASLCHRR
jgi:hypothetical protein